MSTAINQALLPSERRKLIDGGRLHLIETFKSAVRSRKNSSTDTYLKELLVNEIIAGKPLMVCVTSATDFGNQDAEHYEEWTPWQGSPEYLPQSGDLITYYGEDRAVLYALLMSKLSGGDEYASVKDSASVFVDVLVD